METQLTVWGVRGAFPAVDRRFMEYGGNTSCISLTCGDRMLCFDAGSGLQGLVEQLSAIRRLDILISHVHIDHIMGLFSLNTVCGTEIHLYGTARRGISFQRQLVTVIGRPYWPLGLCDPPANIRIHEIVHGDRFSLPWDGDGQIEISTIRGCHPDSSILYRAQYGNTGVTYGLDCEMGGTMDKRLAGFARDTDVLIWDANFTQADLQKGWGHSTWEEGIAVGRAARAGHVLMTHYSRDYTDDFLQEQERLAKQEESTCMFAKEGMVITL